MFLDLWFLPTEIERTRLSEKGKEDSDGRPLPPLRRKLCADGLVFDPDKDPSFEEPCDLVQGRRRTPPSRLVTHSLSPTRRRPRPAFHFNEFHSLKLFLRRQYYKHYNINFYEP